MKEEYDELIELLEPVLYSLPTITETIKKKSTEFKMQKEKGAVYTREQLLEDGMKSFGELVEYFVDQAGKKGLLGKILAKKASSYFAKSLMGMMFNTESDV
jgi:hypothetical protein